MKRKKKKILVVGQTPPPYYGQALMTERLINAEFDAIEIIHVRLAFSDDLLQVGKASWRKLWHLLEIAAQIWKHRLVHRDLVLYYMPAGPNLVPVVRDIMLLTLVRPLFKRTIYHFRAAGISEFLTAQPKLFSSVAKWAYGRPTAAVQLSKRNPADAAFFGATAVKYIPNGMEDFASAYLDKEKHKPSESDGIIRILFVGVLREDKGFTWLVESLHLLLQKGVNRFQLHVMGDFNTKLYEQKVTEMVARFGMEQHVEFLGVKTGSDKWDCFAVADFLCFPSFFDCESFGNVLIEAMMFQLPVIGSKWRGIPDIVTTDVGYLVPVKDVKALADCILMLLQDKRQRLLLGINARKRYQDYYTLEKFTNRMEKLFLSVD